MGADSSDRVIGLDASGAFGSGLRGGVVDGSGALVALKEALMPLTSPAELIEGLATMAARLMQPAGVEGPRPAALGLALPGQIDEVSGIVKSIPNLPLHDTPLASILGERLGLPVHLIHDTGAGILAERLLGAARGMADVLLAVIGTGVGSAVVSGGRLLVGANGIAGEIGHISVDPAGLPCGCGGRGCLETLVSERALAQRYTMLSSQAILPDEVVTRARGGDPAATRVWNEAMAALTSVVADAALLIDCAVVILAGPTSIPAAAVGPVRSVLQRRSSLAPPPRVEASALGRSAGVLGAAAAAFEQLGMSDLTGTWVPHAGGGSGGA